MGNAEWEWKCSFGQDWTKNKGVDVGLKKRMLGPLEGHVLSREFYTPFEIKIWIYPG